MAMFPITQIGSTGSVLSGMHKMSELDNLRQALLNAQLKAQEQQILNQFLPQEKQLGIEASQQQNKFFPLMQQAKLADIQSMIGHRGLQGGLLQQQMEQLRQQMSPEAIERRELEHDLKRREKEASILEKQERANLAKARSEGRIGAGASNQPIFDEEGNLTVPLTRPIQTRLQKQLVGLQKIIKQLPTIRDDVSEYMGASGAAAKGFQTIKGYLGGESSDKLKKYRSALRNIKLQGESLMAAESLPTTKHSLKEMMEMMSPSTFEDPESYRQSMNDLIERLKTNEFKIRSILSKGGISGNQIGQELQESIAPTNVGAVYKTKTFRRE